MWSIEDGKIRLKGGKRVTTILIADDDRNIHKLLELYMKNEGYHILHAYDGQEVLALLQKEEVHLLLLDIMMPEVDGIELCVRIREQANLPILFLSAKSEDLDRIHGLTVGADDYITKPFHPMEVVARVKSHLRRYFILQGPPDKGVIQADGIIINPHTHEVTVEGRPVKLTRREFDILVLLARHRGQVFSIVQIYEQVWKQPFLGTDNTVMVHIRKLREKIEENPKKPKYIQTIWGVGYKFQGGGMK
jgi:DNA-binding response OmpR family regulator